MRKIHQNEIPDPPVSEGECIEYTTNTGRVFHVLAIASDGYYSCPGCRFLNLITTNQLLIMTAISATVVIRARILCAIKDLLRI